MKLLSIVIPTHNAEAYIGEALASIPRSPDLEVIVVDNESEDRTLEIAGRSGREVDRVIREKDRGQADAINKGIRAAGGRYVTWLNADDRYFGGAIERLLPHLDKGEHAWLAGNMIWIDEAGETILKRKGEPLAPWFVRRGWLQAYGPSTFFKKEVVNKVGYLDTDYHYMMDTEYWYRLFDAGYRFHRVSWYVWAFRVHGESKTGPSILRGKENERQREEWRGIARRYGVQRTRGSKTLYRLYRFACWPYAKSYIESLFL